MRYCYGKSVRLSVCLSNAGFVSKRSGRGINLVFGAPPPLQIFKGSPVSGGVKYMSGGKIWQILLFISETVPDRPIVTMEH